MDHPALTFFQRASHAREQAVFLAAVQLPCTKVYKSKSGMHKAGKEYVNWSEVCSPLGYAFEQRRQSRIARLL